jgi:hypothetical protein
MSPCCAQIHSVANLQKKEGLLARRSEALLRVIRALVCFLVYQVIWYSCLTKLLKLYGPFGLSWASAVSHLEYRYKMLPVAYSMGIRIRCCLLHSVCDTGLSAIQHRQHFEFCIATLSVLCNLHGSR